MHLYFEDWSSFTPMLDRKGISHGGRIIKVFASDDNPRFTFANQQLAVAQASHDRFADGEEFVFPGRARYTGADLETAIKSYNLADLGTRTVRALFRFAHERGISQTGMSAKKGDDWLIKHPLDGIHGIDMAAVRPRGEEMLHLDVFMPLSLAILKKTVDYDDPCQLARTVPKFFKQLV